MDRFLSGYVLYKYQVCCTCLHREERRCLFHEEGGSKWSSSVSAKVGEFRTALHSFLPDLTLDSNHHKTNNIVQVTVILHVSDLVDIHGTNHHQGSVFRR